MFYKLILITLITLTSCTLGSKMKTRKIEKMELGATYMSPLLLNVHNRLFWQWAQISTPNTFASASNRQFGHTTIDRDLNFVFTPVEEGFPGVLTAFRASEDGKILWGKEGYRGLWAIDRDTKGKLSNINVDMDGSSEIYEGWMLSAEKSLLLIDVFYAYFVSDELTSEVYTGYDLTTGTKIFRHEELGAVPGPEHQQYGVLIPIGSSSVFYGEKGYRLQEKMKYDWELVTIDEKGFAKPLHNNLTKTLTKKNFSLDVAHQKIKRWDINTRYMFGDVTPPDSASSRDYPSGIIPSVVRWDEKMEEVTVSPLTNHIPKGYRTFGAWAVSPDGKWARCGVGKADYSDGKYVCFFHLDEKYPLGVSPGIIGAASYLKGIFVEHEELGTLYLDWPDENRNLPDHDPMQKAYKTGAVLLYKMSDFFPALTANQTGALRR